MYCEIFRKQVVRAWDWEHSVALVARLSIDGDDQEEGDSIECWIPPYHDLPSLVGVSDAKGRGLEAADIITGHQSVHHTDGPTRVLLVLQQAASSSSR